jgi:hypothetical protein
MGLFPKNKIQGKNGPKQKNVLWYFVAKPSTSKKFKARAPGKK